MNRSVFNQRIYKMKIERNLISNKFDKFKSMGMKKKIEKVESFVYMLIKSIEVKHGFIDTPWIIEHCHPEQTSGRGFYPPRELKKIIMLPRLNHPLLEKSAVFFLLEKNTLFSFYKQMLFVSFNKKLHFFPFKTNLPLKKSLSFKKYLFYNIFSK